MKTIEVENLTAAELAERQAELAKAIDGEPDLPERYIQARLDAKLRDEKLAEQAKTLEALKTGLDAAARDIVARGEREKQYQEQLESAEAKNAGLARDLEATQAEHKEAIRVVVERAEKQHANDSATIDDLRQELSAETERGTRILERATKAVTALATVQQATQAALTTVQTTVSEVLALDELESADRG